jgi:hypothetical protein
MIKRVPKSTSKYPQNTGKIPFPNLSTTAHTNNCKNKITCEKKKKKETKKGKNKRNCNSKE